MAPRRRRPARPGALADLAPLRILTQILVLQFAFYFSAMILIVFTSLTSGKHPTPGLLFDWQSLRGDVTDGWMLGLCWVLTAPIVYVSRASPLRLTRIVLKCLIADGRKQSNRPPHPNRALQTRPRLRNNNPPN